MERRALITGITGQDGYYLTRLLLDKGYAVHGIVRRTSLMSRGRIDQLRDEVAEAENRLTLHYGDLTDAMGILRIVLETEPDEIYNLGAQSHVKVSFEKPAYTDSVNSAGALHVLEAARILDQRKSVRVYQASTSEMFGGLPGTAPQSETTPFHPRSPYGCAKVAAFHYTQNYRESYGLFAANGILFNHESPQRGENFVTRKVTIGATRIREGLQDLLRVGNIHAMRDWGYAGDYVEAMWLMLQHEVPEDFVIATGETHTVEELLEEAFRAVDLEWKEHVEIDEEYFRPAEVTQLLGDPSKARERLGWRAKTTFRDLIRLMIQHDWHAARKEGRESGESNQFDPASAAL